MVQLFKIIRDYFRQNFLFFLIFIIAIFLRTYRLEHLTTFGGDQGQDFLVVRDMVLYQKWTLLGIKTSIAPFFQGPVYLYILYPFFALFKLQPIAGAVSAVVLSALSMFLLYITINKYFLKSAAILSLLFFATAQGLIMYGRTPLYQNFLPLFIILSFYLFFKKNHDYVSLIFLGISVGIGIELHLLNISLAIAFLTFFIFFQKVNFRKLISYIFGIMVGISPTLLFEVRHQFLNTHLFLDYLGTKNQSLQIPDILSMWAEGVRFFIAGNSQLLGLAILLISIVIIAKNKSKQYANIKKLSIILLLILVVFSFKISAIGAHYMLPLWILLIMIVPAFSLKIFPKKIVFVVSLLLVCINLNLAFKDFNNDHGYSMPPGWTLKKTMQVGKLIASDSRKHRNFNVASILDGNTRNYPVRYTTLLYGAIPGDVDQYPNNDYLYVVSTKDTKKLHKTSTWEVAIFRPFMIGKQWNMNEGIILYRLDRIRK